MGFFSKIKGDKTKKKDNNNTEEDLTGEEKEELDININVGMSGVRSPSVDRELSKRHDYEKIRSEISDEMIIRFTEILDLVDTKVQFFTQVEDEGIPLINLVALGVTTEESVNAYQTLRSRGIDTYTADISKTQRVDDDYANEIGMYTQEFPGLREVGVGKVSEPLTAKELYKKENESVIQLEREIRKLESKLREKSSEEPELVEDGGYSQKVQDEVLDISSVFDDFDDIEEEGKANKEEGKMTQKEYSSWNDKFESLKEEIESKQENKENKGEKEEELEAIQSVHKIGKHQESDKEIYVLTKPFDIEENLEGYKVIFIEKPEDLMLFSASKENLLVITTAIPNQLVGMFIEWVKSVSEKGIKVRAVTLKGLEIEHALIEDTIELTQESLDKYYEDYKLSRYIGSGVDTFFDIEKSLEEIDY